MWVKTDYSTQAEKIYSFSVVLAFSLLFFANADSIEDPSGSVIKLGVGKLFYLPCMIALISSVFIKKENDGVSRIISWLIVLAIISTVLNPIKAQPILQWTFTRYVFGILCFKDLRYIEPQKFIKYITYISPIVVILHYILSSPFDYGPYRYGGFYGDPNFLAIALNFIIVLCYLSIKINFSKLLNIFALTSIIGAVPLILAGMSRGGFLGLLVVLFFILRDLYKWKKKIFWVVVIVILIMSAPILAVLGGMLGFIERRFSGESTSDVNGAMVRLEGIKGCFQVFIRRPELILFGIGPGQTLPMLDYYSIFGFRSNSVIHNTFIAHLYEFGIFSFLLLLSLYKRVVCQLYSKKAFLLIGLVASIALGLMTLPGVCFMPAWIALFFLLNKDLSV